MKKTMTQSELIGLVRLMSGLDGTRSDVAIETTDGLDVDAMIGHRLRQWYLELLDTAPVEMLAPENMASSAMLSTVEVSGIKATRAIMPGNCRRVLEVRLRDWLRSVPVLPYENLAAVINRQQNPFTAATASHPIAVYGASAIGGVAAPVMMFPAMATPQLSYLLGVSDPGENIYTFDERALDILSIKL